MDQNQKFEDDVNNYYWVFKPSQCEILSKNSVRIKTDPKSDFWQRTHYGF